MFADVIVDISVEALDRTFQYRIPEQLRQQVSIGSRVKIPFGRGNRPIMGFVVGISEEAKWPPEKIKELLSLEEKDVPIEGRMLKLAAWIRNRYGTTMNEALKTVLPVRRQIKSVEEHWLNFVVSEEVAKKELDRCRLKHYKAKVRLLQGMFAENGQMTAALAAKKYGVTKPVIDGMVKAGILSVSNRKKYRNPYDLTKDAGKQKQLNDGQRRVSEEFRAEFQAGRSHTYLLYGVTGSGKTEVYMEMIEEVLQKDKQVIVLIPEIALTLQTVQRLGERFGARVSLLHSRLSEGERYDQYERAKRGEIDIIIGPRSALFVPFTDLGLIIIDEEHEGSYKSEKPPRYHAREVALELARLSGASVVLGSATPSVETYYAATQGEYKMLPLTKRAAGAQLPKVHIVDLRNELKAGNRSIFSRLLQEKIEDRLRRQEQCMLFLNRRGYAGFVSCRSCGYVLQCSHCEVSMTAHKNRGGRIDTLMCHYCGHTEAMPAVCPECGSPYVAAFGLGTQRVEEMLRKRFPTARILRMDADTTTGKYGHESILEPFRQGKADILLGTQMIVKGHDFPNVTLMSALAADMSMFSSDYRSMEKTFDLLMQASGRAGRADRSGEMVIQTYNPDQYCVEAVRLQDASFFYENELAYRRMAQYPPYIQMVSVLVLSADKRMAKACMEALVSSFETNCREEYSLIGPAEAGLSRAKDCYRYILYIKTKEEAVMDEMLRQIERFSVNTEWGKNCHIQYDRDTINSY